MAERSLTLRYDGPTRDVPALPAGVRECGVADVGVETFLAASNLAFAEVPGADPLCPEDWASMEREAGYREDLVRLLVEDGRVLGFLRGVLEPTAEIEAIGLVPDARRRGLGRWLLRRCGALLRAHGAEDLVLHVAASNEAALQLYRSDGWVQVSR